MLQLTPTAIYEFRLLPSGELLFSVVATDHNGGFEAATGGTPAQFEFDAGTEFWFVPTDLGELNLLTTLRTPNTQVQMSPGTPEHGGACLGTNGVSPVRTAAGQLVASSRPPFRATHVSCEQAWFSGAVPINLGTNGQDVLLGDCNPDEQLAQTSNAEPQQPCLSLRIVNNNITQVAWLSAAPSKASYTTHTLSTRTAADWAAVSANPAWHHSPAVN